MATKLTWQVTVTTAGTAVQGSSTSAGTFVFQANPANSGTYCYIGNDGAGDIASTTGYTLQKGVNQVALVLSNLNAVWFDSDTNGDKIDVVRIGAANEGVTPSAG
jgi:hypothetical protein